jgi:hypothetical protein
MSLFSCKRNSGSERSFKIRRRRREKQSTSEARRCAERR